MGEIIPEWWATSSGISTVFPINGRLRDELLNEMLFTSLGQARVALGYWHPVRTTRDHTLARMEDASEFAIICNQRRELALRYAEGPAPAPIATTAQMGQSMVERPAPTASKC